MTLLFLIFTSFAVLVLLTSARNEDAIVTRLPGLNLPALSFKHFSGHFELLSSEKIFYRYAKIQHEPADAPIVLWLNSGPGCSSLGGFFTDNGPFVVQCDLSIQLNRYAWNRKVNMLCLEALAGVGFSGESYAGMYIPYLVDLLVEQPLQGVNLKGFAIGNPFTDNLIDGNAYVGYYYSHALMSLEAYEKIKVHCGESIGCLYDGLTCPIKCGELPQRAQAEDDEEALNPYFICGDKFLLDYTQARALRKQTTSVMQMSSTHRGDIGPSADSLNRAYLNQPEVKEAIHAPRLGV
ncbi:unnamed protein product [Hyaloperonospora brassicae]|uniref:RxLR effector candidate protein n=1 Tax=Hyaloperonospora brassicae TaxID=162125 RepID=A0AAV0UL04_HYABA|nr:unnamed protein product [Hyaloperonospora brassicae]